MTEKKGGYEYQDPFPLGADTTKYRLLTND